MSWLSQGWLKSAFCSNIFWYFIHLFSRLHQLKGCNMSPTIDAFRCLLVTNLQCSPALNISLWSNSSLLTGSQGELVLLWAQLTKIYPPLPTSVQPISITKTLLIVPTKNERNLPLFTGKLLIKFQNILRNTTQVIIRHRVKILFSVISSPITLERQKWKSSKMKGNGKMKMAAELFTH
jgi:hypothetical protein